jgi:ketosteroid isomerase-like protein
MDTNIAYLLLQQHIQTFVDHPDLWQELIIDDTVWELVYAPSLGHPAKLVGKEAVLKHAKWFVSSVAHWKFSNIRLYPVADPNTHTAIAEYHGEGLITTTGRQYEQDYLLLLRATADGKIAFIREYFDPVRAARSMDAKIPE